MAPTLDDVLRVADEEGVRKSFVRLLVHLLQVDTTVGPDLARVREREERALGLCAQAAETFLGTSRGIERVPISPAIESHPYYTPAHYTRTPERPEGLDARGTYEGRGNLVVRVPGRGRGTLAFNAHVDVVAPYIEPRVDGGVVYGRGACDDKGQCAAMLLALHLVEHARWMCGLVPPAELLFEFVIDEEPGGNGSLSLSLDRRFAFDAMVVLEATSLAVHPGNRGAVWYRLELDGSAAPGLDLVGLAAAAVLALEREGAAIKAESDHPLFPHRPVQTCHGILGPWGKHPSAVNDHVELAFAFDGDAARLKGIIEKAIAGYCADYGDKTKETDPETGRPKVDHHYDLAASGGSAHLVLHGKAGHMGAILRCDDAITKAAYVVRSLEEAGVTGFSLVPSRPAERPATLVLEGGQGFLPTHSLDEVTGRMRRAVAEAAEAYCRQHGAAFDPRLAAMTFDKLHNDAFARDPRSPAVRAFVDCVRAAGVAVEEPLLGWDVSCDARIFAREYPRSDIITFGAGALEHAHSAQEQVRMADVVSAAKAIARFALTYEPKPHHA